MKLRLYLKDKIYLIILSLFSYLLMLMIFLAFKILPEVIISITCIYFLTLISILLIPYFRKKNFYNELLTNIERLDKSYLVLETITKPSFYEGEILETALYDINKSMLENVKKTIEQVNNFKEYIEMWIHEVKIPLSSLILAFNNKKYLDNRIKGELERLDNYVEQVLYYVRSENAEKDYFITNVNLAKVIKNVGLKNMNYLLENKVDFRVENVDFEVLTDAKWLEFILGQIINNSIKYKRNINNSYIKVLANSNNKETTLIIEDNGIGIKKSDISRVFDKTFTGTNGRERKSTGMGLNISKNLCEKLGHKIEIESEYGKYTKVLITFYHNNYFDVLK